MSFLGINQSINMTSVSRSTQCCASYSFRVMLTACVFLYGIHLTDQLQAAALAVSEREAAAATTMTAEGAAVAQEEQAAALAMSEREAAAATTMTAKGAAVAREEQAAALGVLGREAAAATTMTAEGAAVAQPMVLRDEHCSQPFLLGMDVTKDSLQRNRGLAESLSEWVVLKPSHQSLVTYLQLSQIEVARTKRHMYKAAWQPVSEPDVEKAEPTLPATIFDVHSPASSGILVLGSLGVCSIGATDVAEAQLCLFSSEMTLLCCYASSSGMPSIELQLMQTAAEVGIVVILASQHDEVAAWGLAKSVNVERGIFIQCVQLCAGNHHALQFSQLAIQSTSSRIKELEAAISSTSQVAIRQLERASVFNDSVQMPSLNGVCLVTGGTGGLGLLFGHTLRSVVRSTLHLPIL